jgi:hypothetical protein
MTSTGYATDRAEAFAGRTLELLDSGALAVHLLERDPFIAYFVVPP